MADWMFIAAVAGGFGALAVAARRRAAATHRRAVRLGMSARPDLLAVPSELQRTALWALCEGGTETGVVGGRLSLAAHDLEVTAFDLADLRRKRFEWAWLDVDEPFRLHTPLTVVACTIARRAPHVVVKRAGPADRIAPRDHEQAARGVSAAGVDGGALLDAVTTGAVARAATRLVDFRRAAEAPPASLGRAVLPAPGPGPWRAWADPAAPDEARRVIAAIAADAETDAHDRECVVEVLGPLVLAYVASGGPLDPTGLADLIDLAVGASERILVALPALGPRGVEG